MKEPVGRHLLWSPEDGLGALRRVLVDGGLVAFPTESSYGLGADPRDPRGVEAIYRLKGRSASKALPVVAASLEQVEELGAVLTSRQRAQLASCWPAPLTVILPLRQPDSIPAAAEDGTLAVRIPRHELLLELLGELGPLTATSANPSGESPYTEAPAVAAWLATAGEGSDSVRVVAAPACSGAPPSTLVRWSPEGWEVLRQGPVPAPSSAKS
ncbi:MAG: L-threonylcarbamoyladenylate synthase [Acidobacteriota bacterium]